MFPVRIVEGTFKQSNTIPRSETPNFSIDRSIFIYNIHPQKFEFSHRPQLKQSHTGPHPKPVLGLPSWGGLRFAGEIRCTCSNASCRSLWPTSTVLSTQRWARVKDVKKAAEIPPFFLFPALKISMSGDIPCFFKI